MRQQLGRALTKKAAEPRLRSRPDDDVALTLLRPQPAAQDFHERPRDVVAVREAVPLETGHAGGSELRQLFEQAALADPCVAGQKQHLAPPGARELVESMLQTGELGLAPDERRRRRSFFDGPDPRGARRRFIRALASEHFIQHDA